MTIEETNAPLDGDGDHGYSDVELRALLARARRDDDAELRRLVNGYITLRRLAADAVMLIETQFGGATVVQAPLLQRLRELVRRRGS